MACARELLPGRVTSVRRPVPTRSLATWADDSHSLPMAAKIWPKRHGAELPVTVVTACDGKFRDAALNLIGSVQHYGGVVGEVLVYDLGMTAGDRRRFEG